MPKGCKIGLIFLTSLFVLPVLAGHSIFKERYRPINTDGVDSIGVYVCDLSGKCSGVKILPGECELLLNSHLQNGVCQCDDGYEYNQTRNRCVSAVVPTNPCERIQSSFCEGDCCEESWHEECDRYVTKAVPDGSACTKASERGVCYQGSCYPESTLSQNECELVGGYWCSGLGTPRCSLQKDCCSGLSFTACQTCNSGTGTVSNKEGLCDDGNGVCYNGACVNKDDLTEEQCTGLKGAWCTGRTPPVCALDGNCCDPACDSTTQECVDGNCIKKADTNDNSTCAKNSDCDAWCESQDAIACYCSILATHLGEENDSDCYNNFSGTCATISNTEKTNRYSSDAMTWWSAMNFCKAINRPVPDLNDDYSCNRTPLTSGTRCTPMFEENLPSGREYWVSTCKCREAVCDSDYTCNDHYCLAFTIFSDGNDIHDILAYRRYRPRYAMCK